MLFIDGKRVSEDELEKYLTSYNKVVTVTLSSSGKGRQSTNHGFVQPTLLRVNVPMRYTFNDPNKNGRSVSVVYSLLDDVETDTYGNIKKEYQPKPYVITQPITMIKTREHAELVVALALNPYNSAHYSLGASATGTSAPVFTMAKRGAVAVQSTEKDELMMTALSYIVGEKKISDHKAMAIYQVLGLDPLHLENEDIKSIRAELSSYAKNSPEKLIAAVTDSLGDMKSKIATAFERGILMDSAARKITWGANVADRDHTKTICQYGIGADKIDRFADFLVKSDLDGDVRNKLLEELEAPASA